eukprot:Awhi_evm1s12214
MYQKIQNILKNGDYSPNFWRKPVLVTTVLNVIYFLTALLVFLTFYSSIQNYFWLSGLFFVLNISAIVFGVSSLTSDEFGYQKPTFYASIHATINPLSSTIFCLLVKIVWPSTSRGTLAFLLVTSAFIHCIILLVVCLGITFHKNNGNYMDEYDSDCDEDHD